ncbi:MAG: AAC(3) family N-acetyltransferase [Clostridia bacterium]|nr:AAC(3) family N-acetyltransferase [Clostridia bacterium]
MSETKETIILKIADDLKKLGIKEDDTILMHSSLSSLGYVEGGADTVIDALLSVLKNGTLLLPALSYATVNINNPVFSVKDTPTCSGRIPETFRTREGVLRSIHPTHSVCGIGKYAKEILSQHINTDTPVGPTSPFALLPKYNGKILMLGCTMAPNTSMHGVEELSRPWYLMKPERTTFTLIDENGNETVKAYECHNFKGVLQRYARVANLMEVQSGKVLEADCYLIDAKKMWEVAPPVLAEHEEYFIDRNEEI